MTIHHPGGGSDDLADALMLASWAFRLRATAEVAGAGHPLARSALGVRAKNRQDDDGLTAGDEVKFDHIGDEALRMRKASK